LDLLRVIDVIDTDDVKNAFEIVDRNKESAKSVVCALTEKDKKFFMNQFKQAIKDYFEENQERLQQEATARKYLQEFQFSEPDPVKLLKNKKEREKEAKELERQQHEKEKLDKQKAKDDEKAAEKAAKRATVAISKSSSAYASGSPPSPQLGKLAAEVSRKSTLNNKEAAAQLAAMQQQQQAVDREKLMKMPSKDKFKATALYDNFAAQETDLEFSKGDAVIVTLRHESGWWRGECNGLAGLFQAKMVELSESASPKGTLTNRAPPAVPSSVTSNGGSPELAPKTAVSASSAAAALKAKRTNSAPNVLADVKKPGVPAAVVTPAPSPAIPIGTNRPAIPARVTSPPPTKGSQISNRPTTAPTTTTPATKTTTLPATKAAGAGGGRGK